MFHVITGGSGSGKSEYAEKMIMKYHETASQADLYYVATMIPFGEEAQKKIERHRRMRSGKGFQTIECPSNLKETMDNILQDSMRSSVLLECMSNLTANELYTEGKERAQAVGEIMEGIQMLAGRCEHLVVVTNEVFSESVPDLEEMRRYKEVLGEINRKMAVLADAVTEVVYGIPVEVKR